MPISYASKRTNNAEENYGATHLEILAVVWAVEHYNEYLAGAPFTLETDHQPLKSLLNLGMPKGVYACFLMHLQAYTINVVIKPGCVHGNADALSRTPHHKPHHPYFLECLPHQGPWLANE